MAQAEAGSKNDDNEVVEGRSPIPDFGMREEMLREHLFVATQHRNKAALNKALRDYMASGLPTDTDIVEEGARKLDILSTRDAIKEATKERDLELLNKYLRGIKEQEDLIKDRAERSGRAYSREEGISVHMEYELQEARKVLRDAAARVKRRTADKPAQLAMDKNAMSEVRSYQKPPRGVHSIMQATYLLLGEDEDTTMDWLVCAKMTNPIGPSGLQKRLMKFDYKRCHPELVSRAREILDKIHFDDMVKASRGGACFYVYANGIIEDFERDVRSIEDVEPAQVLRQREILNRVILDPKERAKEKRAKQLAKERKSTLVEPKY